MRHREGWRSACEAVSQTDLGRRDERIAEALAALYARLDEMDEVGPCNLNELEERLDIFEAFCSLDALRTPRTSATLALQHSGRESCCH